MARRGDRSTRLEPSAAGPRKGGAFTLVELLVVVGIIALLVTILMPSLSRALELTRRTICQTNLKALGTGWQIYFQDNNGGIPRLYDRRSSAYDGSTQFDFLIWTCNDEAYPQHCNSGRLFAEKLIGDRENYVCPTIRRNSGGNWFTDRTTSNGSYFNLYVNPWPPYRGSHTTSTYGRRRTTYYDDKALSQLPGNDARNKEIILSMAGANVVTRPGDFSFMADSFHWPEVALLSHVPQLNVMYLDGHVGMFEDTEENVIYDNDVTTWGVHNNWTLDTVWMIIDGYRQGPAGS